MQDRKLVVNEYEAGQVRHIMRRYLALGSVMELADDLNRDGYRTKVQRRTSGPHRGGCIVRRGTLYHLLSNRIYRGMIVHKGTAYPGEHEAIIDEELWNKVQEQLERNASGSSRRKKHQHPSLLIGKLYDGEGRAMTPSHAQRAKKRYRYYVTRPDQLDGSPAWRVNAHDLEALVCSELASKLDDGQSVLALIGGSELEAGRLKGTLEKAGLTASVLRSGAAQAKAELLCGLVEQVRLEDDQVIIAIKPDHAASLLEIEVQALAEDQLTLTVPAIRVRKGHQLRLVIPGSEEADAPIRQRDDKLIALIAEAHEARKLILQHRARSIASIAKEQGKCRTRLGKLATLSCMAPEIVKDILQGHQPQSLDAKRLMRIELPLDWNEQRLALGYSKP